MTEIYQVRILGYCLLRIIQEFCVICICWFIIITFIALLSLSLLFVTTVTLDNGDYIWKGGWVIKRHYVPFPTTWPLDQALSLLTIIGL